jgi:hypothetical protein
MELQSELCLLEFCSRFDKKEVTPPTHMQFNWRRGKPHEEFALTHAKIMSHRNVLWQFYVQNCVGRIDVSETFTFFKILAVNT